MTNEQGSARAPSTRFEVEQVVSGLRLMGYGFLAHAGIVVVHRIANELLFVGLRSGSISRITSMMTALFTVTRLMGLGASILLTLGAARLGKLPPHETEKAPQAYRDAPGLVRTTRDGGLAPFLLGALVATIVLDVCGMAVDFLPGAHAPRDGMGVRDFVWFASLFADIASQILLLVWIRRVMRSFASASSSEGAASDPSAMIALTASIVGVRGLYLVYYVAFKPKLPSVFTWLTLGAYVGSMVLLFLLTSSAGRAITRAAASMIAGGEPAAAPPREALGPSFRRAADGLERYATAIKVQIAIGVISAVLTVLFASSKSTDGVFTMLTLSPIAGLAVSALAISGLIGYANVPEDTGAATPARMAAVLFGLSALGHVYHLTLVPALTSDDIFTKIKAVENVPYVLGATQIMGFAATMILLASLRKAAIAAGDNALSLRVDGVTKLFYATLVLGVLVIGTMMSRDLAPFATMAGLVLVIVALLALVRYLGVLRDVVEAMRR